ncbi:acyl-n-acyltransferase [Diplodia corticola]|uniref:Acyl-n-acyltransferase n=1 Tax=Diplodia corticola TaxID=236234 RepID=A0A1J9QZA9_9PEZI|nr:acyl-n-acyltransferase [Diplodia corticola]OJD33314.1 acyl-n-acyltransferase [Diplodia corticola]
MISRSKIQLIPWDPESPDHIQRLVEQRVQCGWHQLRVASKWRDEQRSGVRCLYWICFSPGDPELEEKLRRHRDAYPKEKDALRDTGASIRGVPRTPSMADIHPIGHISLDQGNSDAADLNLDLPDSGVYWIKNFYISNVLQSGGVGRAAMDMIEAMAVEEPLCAKTLALDTVHVDDQVLNAGFFTAQGLPQRKMSNHEWYRRRGYREIKVVQNFYREPDAEGNIWDIKTVFMRRDIG